MINVGTLAKIRRMHLRDGLPIKEIERRTGLARNTIKVWLRKGEMVQPKYPQRVVVSKLDGFTEMLATWLKADQHRGKRDRRTIKALYEALAEQGYSGGYGRVAAFARRWREEESGKVGKAAFVPLKFALGDAFQFDWSTEYAWVGGLRRRLEVAHTKLCGSRAFWLVAYPTQSHEMLFDAHARAFAFFGGVPRRGIYDNMKTAVTAVFTGKERVFNRRFLIMTDHYMVEPTACSPAAGWEKGQVEQQVQTIRGRFFQPRLRFASLAELNGWLEAECRRWAEHHAHPERGDITVAEALDMERPALQPILAPFDGFHESEHAVTGTCLISFDRNRYSVMSTAARRTVQVRSYADRIVIRCGDAIVGEHERHFGRNRTIYDPWHYLPVLAHKPGALRNGAPFQDWDLPPALHRLRRRLGAGDEADRRFVRVLSAVLTDGLEPVEAAVREALANGTASDELILNILSRRREPATPHSIVTSEDRMLQHPPLADCARYDLLRGYDAAA